MNLALFDLDHTILNGDSDHAWGLFLAETGVVDAASQQERQDYFYNEYVNGTLDIYEFCEYQFTVLTQHKMADLLDWRAKYIESIVQPMIDSGKADLIEHHRRLGDELVIITATNDFVTSPIAKILNVDVLIATQAEMEDGRYTGRVAGTPSFKEGKVERLKQWLAQQEQSYEHTVFYSDSYNDMPLLDYADTPIAVTPDDRLRQHALAQGWRIID
ncbi:MAG: HAD family hydrolase [Pseudomonadota bacterium]